MDGLDALRTDVAHFASERDWEQFHSPKNLVLALTGEVGELAAELQWLGEAEVKDLADPANSSRARQRLEDEVADVFIYLVRLADVTGIDLLAAAKRKVETNRARYPVDAARGNAKKYTRLGVDDERGDA